MKRYDKKRSSAGNKAYIAEQRKAKNKTLKLNRHLKQHPNDEQAIEAL